MLASETADGLLMMDAQGLSTEEAHAQIPTDGALVEAARQGDREAFGRLYHQYAPMVHGLLLARTRYDDVRDLVQDVFVTAYTKLPGLREARAFPGWLAMIARNRALDHHRLSRETEELTDDFVAPDESRAKVAEILCVIRGLPDAYRETLVLRLVEGMTGPEIAARTGLQPESVRVNLHRGMKMLREKLEAGGWV